MHNRTEFVKRHNGSWNHCTRIKCICNPILRKIQFFTNKPFVIASICDINGDQVPVFKYYVFTRVEYSISRTCEMAV